MPSRAPISSIARSNAAGVAEAQPVARRRPPSPTRSCRRSRSCRGRARRSARSPPGPRRDRRCRPAGRARTRSRTRRAPSGRPCVVMIRSQPIEHDAQLSRTAARSSSASVVVSVPKLRPGSAESALNVEQVGERAEVAVLRGGRPERARAEILARRRAPRPESATGQRAAARTATALSRLAPSTAPSPPRPAWRPSCETVA